MPEMPRARAEETASSAIARTFGESPWALFLEKTAGTAVAGSFRRHDGRGRSRHGGQRLRNGLSGGGLRSVDGVKAGEGQDQQGGGEAERLPESERSIDGGWLSHHLASIPPGVKRLVSQDAMGPVRGRLLQSLQPFPAEENSDGPVTRPVHFSIPGREYSREWIFLTRGRAGSSLPDRVARQRLRERGANVRPRRARSLEKRARDEAITRRSEVEFSRPRRSCCNCSWSGRCRCRRSRSPRGR